MRYWGTDSRVTETTGRGRRARSTSNGPRAGRRDAGPSRARAAGGAGSSGRAASSRKEKPSLASGGSVKPFLRKVYRHQAAISRPIQRMLLFLVLAGLIYAFVLGDGGAVRILMLRHERAELQNNITSLQHDVSLLQGEITKLRDDPAYIEKIGRERYGYVRKDEKVFKIVPEEGSK